MSGSRSAILRVSGGLMPFALAGMGLQSTYAGAADQGERSVVVRPSVVNLPREADPESPSGGDYYEVYRDSLAVMPVVLEVSLWTKPEGTAVPLAAHGRRWNDETLFTSERDGEILDDHYLRRIADFEMAVTPEQGRRGDWTDARRLPDALRDGEALAGFFEVVGPHGALLDEGKYRVQAMFRDNAQGFFGMKASPSEGAVPEGIIWRVKRCEGDESRCLEDLIERHYLWACWLYKFDRVASKKEFQKAWELVSNYLRQGAGDGPGLWNITPRYQASRIAGWLDDKVSQISYLSQLIAEDSTAAANGQDCKMRFYHFHQERGHLPPNVRDDLTFGLNRLYERVYGKTMSGQPVPPMEPLGKNFPEATESDEVAPGAGGTGPQGRRE